MPQHALKTLASSVLHHYPFDFHLNRYWSAYVCEHGNDREFCRECVTHHCDCREEYLAKLEAIVKEVHDDPKTSKFMKDKINEAMKG